MSALALASPPDHDGPPTLMSAVPASNSPEFLAALFDARGEFPALVKDANNPHHKSRYATLGATLETIEPVLRSHGFQIFQTPVPVPGGWALSTRIVHRSGEELAGLVPLILGDDRNAMQAQGSAITYARRYALQCMLCLVAEDDDANGSGASAHRAPPPRQTPQEPRQRPQQSAPPKSQAPRQQPQQGQQDAPEYPSGGVGLLAWLTDLTNQHRYNWVEWAVKHLGEPNSYPANVAEWDVQEADWAAKQVEEEMNRRAKANQSKRR